MEAVIGYSVKQLGYGFDDREDVVWLAAGHKVHQFSEVSVPNLTPAQSSSVGTMQAFPGDKAAGVGEVIFYL